MKKTCLLCGTETEVNPKEDKPLVICQVCMLSKDIVLSSQVKGLTRLFDQVFDKKKLGA